MRLFIAIDIPKSLKAEILRIQEEIKNLGRINIVPKENLHITLKFLGEVDDSKVIIKALEEIEFEKFSIISGNAGFFPTDNFINVIWIGFNDDEKLLELQQQIDNILSKKFKKEKNFISHATIARVKYLPVENKEEFKKLKNRKITPMKFKVESFKLMKSILTQQGAIYETIKEFKAKGL